MSTPLSFCVLFLLTNKRQLIFFFCFPFFCPYGEHRQRSAFPGAFPISPLFVHIHRNLLICYWIKFFFSNVPEVSFTLLSLTILKVGLFLSYFQWSPVQGPGFHDSQASLCSSLTGGLLFSKPILFSLLNKPFAITSSSCSLTNACLCFACASCCLHYLKYTSYHYCDAFSLL